MDESNSLGLLVQDLPLFSFLSILTSVEMGDWVKLCSAQMCLQVVMMLCGRCSANYKQQGAMVSFTIKRRGCLYAWPLSSQRLI